MGCWNETCVISNLPIQAGDPTYFIMLTQTPWEDKDGRTGCHYNDHWFLRSLPVLGEYNDYGSIEKWEKDWVHDLIVEQLKLDLSPKKQSSREKLLKIPAQSVGTITFDYVLGWLQEGNVKVRSNVGGFRRNLNVVKCMIRKDVWDMLLQMCWRDFRSSYSHQRIEEDIWKYMEILQKANKIALSKKFSMGASFEFKHLVSESWFENSFISPFYASPKPGPTTTGGYEFFKKWVDDRFIDGSFSEEEAFQKYRKIGEVVHVEHMLCDLRKSWCPTTGTGSQEQNWDQSFKFNLNIAKLAYKKEMTGLSENLGFFKEDFDGDLDKEDKYLFENMRETQRQRKEINTSLRTFKKEISKIDRSLKRRS